MADARTRNRTLTPRRIAIIAVAIATISGAVSGAVGYVVGFSLGRTPPPIVIQVSR
jgi:hypothetical protein